MGSAENASLLSYISILKGLLKQFETLDVSGATSMRNKLREQLKNQVDWILNPSPLRGQLHRQACRERDLPCRDSSRSKVNEMFNRFISTTNFI